MGYYGCGNVGDDLLLSVILKQVLSWRSVSQVIIKCLHLPPVNGDKRIRFETCESILSDSSLPRWLKAWRYSIRMWKALKGVSIFIFGGGTLFHAENGSPTNLLLLLFVVAMARLRGARVYALGVGVSPIRGVVPKTLMSALLLLSRDFAVRDTSSMECCRTLAGGSLARKTADLVFLLDFPPRISKKACQRVVGLTLASSAIHLQTGCHSNALKELAGVLNQLGREGWTLRFLSFQELIIGDFQLSDSMLLESLKHSGLEATIDLVEVNSKRDAVAEVFSELDLVIGMRFHGLVLAAISGIPFIGIGSDHKLSDLCEKYGAPFFPVTRLNGQQLLSAVNGMKEQIPDPKITEELKDAARKNLSAFQTKIANRRGY